MPIQEGKQSTEIQVLKAEKFVELDFWLELQLQLILRLTAIWSGF